MRHVFLPVLLSALWVVGCAPTLNTHGNIVLPSKLTQVKVGETTREQVQTLLGSPSVKSSFDANTWYYVTTTTKTTALIQNQLMAQKVLAVTFDPSGTVAALKEVNQADGKQVTPLDDSTPTHGQSLGIVEQLLGNLGLGNP